MLEDITNIDIDQFLSIISNADILSLHTRTDRKHLGCEDSFVSGGDLTKTIEAIRDAEAGANLCLTYQDDPDNCRHLTFIKIDDTELLICENKIGYTFTSGEILSKIFKHRAEPM